jgi:hypothetical protein
MPGSLTPTSILSTTESLRLCDLCAAGSDVPAGGYEGSPSCESTMPGGLTSKQRIAWKKEEEQRRRQLELQVT